MGNYRVNIYKTLQNDTGHNFKCFQTGLDVCSANPIEALQLAEKDLDFRLEDADCVEITLITSQNTATERDLS